MNLIFYHNNKKKILLRDCRALPVSVGSHVEAPPPQRALRGPQKPPEKADRPAPAKPQSGLMGLWLMLKSLFFYFKLPFFFFQEKNNNNKRATPFPLGQSRLPRGLCPLPLTRHRGGGPLRYHCRQTGLARLPSRTHVCT